MDDGRLTERGLTLLELLVVLAILALTTTVVVFNAPPPRSGAKIEAERFAARAAAGVEAAVMSGAPTRLRIAERGYSFERFDGEKWVEQGDARLFAARALPANISLVATPLADIARNEKTRDGAPPDDVRWVNLDPMGAVDPIELVFADGRTSWRVTVSASGAIEVARDGA